MHDMEGYMVGYMLGYMMGYMLGYMLGYMTWHESGYLRKNIFSQLIWVKIWYGYIKYLLWVNL